MNVPASLGELLRLLAWGGDPAVDPFVVAVIALGSLAIVSVHGSLAVRLLGVRSLARDVERLYESTGSSTREGLGRDLDRCFAGSPLSETWSELLRRRRAVEAHSPQDQAPVRFGDVLDEQPLIPLGMRRQLLAGLPLLMIALGLAGTVAALIPGLLGAGLDGSSLAGPLGLGLRSGFWGIALAAVAGLLGRLLEGAAQSQRQRLDRLVERSYRSLSPGEIVMRGVHAQQLGFERVSSLLVQVAEDLRDTIDRGLVRIERSTASAASLVSEEQRHAIELVMEDLSGLMRRGVEEHVSTLRGTLDVTAQTQRTLSDRLTETIDQVTAGSEINARVSGSLERASEGLDRAAGTISSGASELKPLVEHLGDVAGALERTAARIEQASVLASQTGANDTAPIQATFAEFRTEVLSMGQRLAEIVQPLAPALGRLDGSAEAIAQSLAEFTQRASSLESRLAMQTNGAQPSPAASTPPSAPAPLVEVDPIDQADPIEARHPAPRGDGRELAAAVARSGGIDAPEPTRSRSLEPTQPRRAASGGAPEAARAPQPEAPVVESPPNRAAPHDTIRHSEASRRGYSALLNRYSAPRFSIDELPEDLRSFTADEALERARQGGSPTPVRPPRPDAEDPQRTPATVTAAPAAAASTGSANSGASASASEQEAAARRVPPALSAQPDDGDKEERRRRRLERFFGSGQS